jgi:polysaccharide pyruvyl transferase WcaK-like protein
MMRALLINDTERWYHWGCTATSRGLKALIAERHELIGSLPLDESTRLAEPPEGPPQFVEPGFFVRHAAANPEVYRAVAEAELIVVNGEGTLHGVRRPVGCLLYLMWAAKRHLGKTVWLVNHSAYPDDATIPPRAAIGSFYARVYRALDYVAVREPVSCRLLRDLGIPAVESADCLPLTFAALPPASAHGGAIVVAGAAEFPEARLPELADLLREWTADGTPLVLPLGAAAKPAADEARFAAALKSLLPALTILDCASLEAWRDCLAGARLLVSGRFHHSLAAFCVGTPFVALDTHTPKLAGLSAMLGLPEPIRHDAPDWTRALRARLAWVEAERVRFGDAGRLAELRALARRNVPE